MALRIPHDCRVIVSDGRKALFLRNEGDEIFPNLQTERVLENTQTDATHSLGSDRPGRVHQSADSRRSAMQQTDFHDEAERRFAGEVVKAMMELERGSTLPKLVVVAPPRTLAVLRKDFPSRLRAHVVAEVDKDLTGHPVYEIERVLSGR